MRRLAQRVYYFTETLLTRGPLYQLMLVAGVILALSVGGGIFVHITNPDSYSNTLEAIWCPTRPPNPAVAKSPA